MNDKLPSKNDPAKRLAELRQGRPDNAAQEPEEEGQFAEGEPEQEVSKAYSQISADRRKEMVDFRFQNGNAKARAYSYLVGVDYDPSEGIRLDFSGYEVIIKGRNLWPLYAGLVAQRVAVVREMDAFQAAASMPESATVVTGITIKAV